MVVIVAAGFAASASADKVFPRVSIDGTKVGGMTYDEARQAMEESGFSGSGDKQVEIVLTEDVSIPVTGDEAGFPQTPEDAARLAVAYGKNGNFFTNAFKYIGCVFGAGKLSMYDPSFIDRDSVRAAVDEVMSKTKTECVQHSYTVEDNTLVVIKGYSGIQVDTDAVCDAVCKAFEDENFEPIQFEGNVEEPEPLDLQKIYEEVYVEPKDAEYDIETKSVTDHVTGMSLDILAAKKLLDAAGEGEVVRIPLVLTEPEYTKELMEEKLFRDVLGEKSTTLSGSSSNRVTNITLAAQAINGTILNPGEEFSFNGTVGERTAQKGYKAAGAYSGGQSVQEIGGGICQVSSTIYYCALLGDLKITARDEHMFPVAYLPMGLDATVSWGSLDFRFVNSTNYPLKIIAYVQNGQLYVQLVGTDEDEGYIELSSKTLSSTPYSVIYKEDSSLAPGQEKVESSGHTGYRVEAFKSYYDKNGKLIETVSLGISTYRKTDRVILVGPAAEPEPTPTPTPTPDPTPTPTPTPTPDPEPTPETTEPAA